ncbi:MAG: hypothetical protein KAT25_03495 [Sulfuriflexus sp.]|nr:hypothetical protein [Sulfuriflexus sp.]
MPPEQHAINILTALSFFANKKTNLVLDVLAGQTPHENEKFPKGELNFADSGWRGFYHCHSAEDKDPEEHGHFHLFVCCGEEQWTHVAALSIDNQGQPRSWFTVNQWVTGANWLSANDTLILLDNIQVPVESTITEKFLLSMLGLYHDDLSELLLERDRRLTQINAGANMDDTLQDRDVYVLSFQPIALQERLFQSVRK